MSKWQINYFTLQREIFNTDITTFMPPSPQKILQNYVLVICYLFSNISHDITDIPGNYRYFPQSWEIRPFSQLFIYTLQISVKTYVTKSPFSQKIWQICLMILCKIANERISLACMIPVNATPVWNLPPNGQAFFFITHNTKNSLATQRIPMTCGFLRQHTELPTLLPKKRASSNSCFRGSRLCRFTLLSITTQPTKQRKRMTIHSHLHLNMRPFNKRSNVLAKCQLENQYLSDKNFPFAIETCIGNFNIF